MHQMIDPSEFDDPMSTNLYYGILMDIVGRVGYSVASIHYQDFVFLLGVLTPILPQTPNTPVQYGARLVVLET